jgi:hypothetical protein
MYCLHLQGRKESQTGTKQSVPSACCLLFCLIALLFNLKMEAVRYSKMSIILRRTSRHHIVEDSNYLINSENGYDLILG